MNRKTFIVLASFLFLILVGCEQEKALIPTEPTPGARIDKNGEWFVNSIFPFHQTITKDPPRIIIVFTGPMDRESVETALTITPEVEYQTFWAGNVFKIVFIDEYQIHESFTVSLTKTIKTADGQKRPPTSWFFSNQIPQAAPNFPQ